MILQINWAPILLVRLFLEYQLRLRFSLELYGSGVLKGWGKSTLQRPVLCPSSPAIHETTLIPAVCVYMPVRRIGLRPDDSNISDTSIDNCGTTWKKTLMQEKKKKKNPSRFTWYTNEWGKRYEYLCIWCRAKTWYWCRNWIQKTTKQETREVKSKEEEKKWKKWYETFGKDLHSERASDEEWRWFEGSTLDFCIWMVCRLWYEFSST